MNRTVENYSVNKSGLNTYYNVGKILNEVGKHYGEGIIKEYSKKLTIELGKGYSKRNLWLMLKFYKSKEKMQTLSAQLSWSHYDEFLRFDDINKIAEEQNLSIRQLRLIIKSNEYKRLPKDTRVNLVSIEESKIFHHFSWQK